MASISIVSSNPKFSYVIRKNPETGMIAKGIRKGTMFGWYSKEKRNTDNTDSSTKGGIQKENITNTINQYNIYFQDDVEGISFGREPDMEFEYIDTTRYNSPLILSTIMKEFFGSNLKEEPEEDIKSYNKIKITSIQINRKSVIDNLVRYFGDFKFRIEPLPHENEYYNYNNYSMEIESENCTLHELINLVYMFSYIIAVMEGIKFSIDISVIFKILKACNTLNSPYYFKYLVKSYMVHNQEDFIKIKEELNKSKDGTVYSFEPESNYWARIHSIRPHMIGDNVIVDIGCGEGNLVRTAERITRTYYAIDRDETCRNKVLRKVEKYKLDNVQVLSDVEEFFDIGETEKFTVVMSEVFEHNELSYTTGLISKLFSKDNCDKIIITTPNKDFNKYYLMSDDEKRHKDHLFEMSTREFVEYFNTIGTELGIKVRYYEVGDKVNGIPTTIMVILKRE